MNVSILQGDCRSVLQTIPDASIHCCVTSPPYWGLRDYGHARQIGLEESPEKYVSRLVEVFARVWRVLRPDGTLWVNLGDSYSAGKCGRSDQDEISLRRRWEDYGTGRPKARGAGNNGKPRTADSLNPKNLVGIPWRVAFALQASGWYLRSDIIWHKPNPMPESVTDRPTKAHEYLFLLSKSERYYYDAESVKEKSIDPESLRPEGRNPRNGDAFTSSDPDGKARTRVGFSKLEGVCYPMRNRRTVWTVATSPYADAHFATYPPDLIKPCILAGCPVGGTVLDPFGGSGTTGQVALELGRKAILIELNPEYVKLAEQRCNVTPGLALA